MVAVGIITAPRKELTLGNSLQSFLRQDAGEPFIFAEPGSVIPKGRNKVFWNNVTLGGAYNWMNAASTLIRYTEEEYIMICEDDVDYSRDCLSIMLDRMQPDIVLSGWTSEVNATFGITGWAPHANVELYGLCGTLCLLFHRKVLTDVLLSPYMTAPNRIHVDTDVGFALKRLGITSYCHHPSLVTHTGVGISTFYKMTTQLDSEVRARRCYATCRSRR